MCQRLECPTCNRPTYTGCGNHVEQVLGDVAVEDRCSCGERATRSRASRQARSWFGRRV